MPKLISNDNFVESRSTNMNRGSLVVVNDLLFYLENVNLLHEHLLAKKCKSNLSYIFSLEVPYIAPIIARQA